MDNNKMRQLAAEKFPSRWGGITDYRAIAKASGLGQSTIAKILNSDVYESTLGTVRVKPATAALLAKTLGVPVPDIFDARDLADVKTGPQPGRAKNKEFSDDKKSQARMRRFRESHHDDLMARNREYVKTHPEAIKVIQHRKYEKHRRAVLYGQMAQALQALADKRANNQQ